MDGKDLSTPQNLDNKYRLSYYSQIFDFVEIGSTFYRIPSKFMVNNWFKRTPDNFRGSYCVLISWLSIAGCFAL